MVRRTVTIKDIARVAGVSHSTVSRSLNDSTLISEDTKSRIKKIARDMSFEFNANARSLSTRRTGTVGIIFPELFDTFGNTLYMGLLVSGLRQELEEASLDSIGTFPLNHFTGESNIRKLINRKKVDGFLIINPEVPSEDWDYIRKMETPFVVLHFKPKNRDYSLMDYLFTDHIAGGYLATSHLVKQGCRRIITLTEAVPELQFQERIQGYRQALTESGISVEEDTIIGGECSFDFGYEAIRNLGPEKIKKIDGIFAQADIIALGALEGLRDSGFRVPEDIRLIGYDDTELGKYFRPRLSTIHQPREEHARKAITRLIELLEGTNPDDPLQEIFIPRLIIRDSCGAAAE